MKKKYVNPLVEINKTMIEQMVAISLQPGAADNSEVLSKKQQDWNIWTEE